MAVGHTILVTAEHLRRDGTTSVDLGGTYFDQRARDTVLRRAVHRIEALGIRVHLEPMTPNTTTPSPNTPRETTMIAT